MAANADIIEWQGASKRVFARMVPQAIRVVVPASGGFSDNAYARNGWKPAKDKTLWRIAIILDGIDLEAVGAVDPLGCGKSRKEAVAYASEAIEKLGEEYLPRLNSYFAYVDNPVGQMELLALWIAVEAGLIG